MPVRGFFLQFPFAVVFRVPGAEKFHEIFIPRMFEEKEALADMEDGLHPQPETSDPVFVRCLAAESHPHKSVPMFRLKWTVINRCIIKGTYHKAA